jgi:hypothetical protein
MDCFVASAPRNDGETALFHRLHFESGFHDEDSEDIMTREGGCLCGAVRFKAAGEPINVRICHCRNCQKAMGSPFFARALFDQTALTVDGETARYASSERLDRVFCKTCGTRLFAWRRIGTLAGVALAAFDDRNAFTPTDHMWVTEKIDWVKLDDGLAQYPETAP